MNRIQNDGFRSPQKANEFLRRQQEASAANIQAQLEEKAAAVIKEKHGNVLEIIAAMGLPGQDPQLPLAPEVVPNPVDPEDLVDSAEGPEGLKARETLNVPLQAMIAFMAMIIAYILADNKAEAKEGPVPSSIVPGIVLVNNAGTELIKQTYGIERKDIVQIITEIIIDVMKDLSSEEQNVQIVPSPEGGINVRIGEDIAVPIKVSDEQVFKVLENFDYQGLFQQHLGILANKCMRPGQSGESTECKESNKNYQKDIRILEGIREKEGKEFNPLKLTIVTNIQPEFNVFNVAVLTADGPVTTNLNIQGLLGKKAIKEKLKQSMGARFKEIIKREILSTIVDHIQKKLEEERKAQQESSQTNQTETGESTEKKTATPQKSEKENPRGFRLSAEGSILPHATNPDENKSVKLTFAGGLKFDADIYNWENISLTGGVRALFSEGGNNEGVNTDLTVTPGVQFDLGKWAVKTGIGVNLNFPGANAGIYGEVGGQLQVFKTKDGFIALYPGVNGFLCYSPNEEALKAGILYSLTVEFNK